MSNSIALPPIDWKAQGCRLVVLLHAFLALASHCCLPKGLLVLGLVCKSNHLLIEQFPCDSSCICKVKPGSVLQKRQAGVCHANKGVILDHLLHSCNMQIADRSVIEEACQLVYFLILQQCIQNAGI